MELPPLYALAFAAGTTLFLLSLWRLVQRLVSPGATLASELRGDNAARPLLQVGQVLGIFLVAASAVKNCVGGEAWTTDVLRAGGFGVLGLSMVAVSGEIGTRLLLRSRLRAEVARGNVAAGVAGGAHFVATGIVSAHAIAGEKLRDAGLSVLFFGVAIATLWAFVGLFRALTTYDDAEQIQGENLAAALSYAGLSVAVGIIVGAALDGDFVSLASSLQGFAVMALLAFGLYPVRQLLVQTVLLGARPSLRGGTLDRGVGVDRNAGVAALEAATYLATALAITWLV